MLSNNGNKKRIRKILKWLIVILIILVSLWQEYDGVLDGKLQFPYFEELLQTELQATPEPETILEPEVTPKPTATPKSATTQKPNVTPKATSTPKPTTTKKPNATSKPTATPKSEAKTEKEIAQKTTATLPPEISADKTLKLTVYDVGQADCIVIQQGNQYMMVDCGTSGVIDSVIKKLKSQNINELKYLVVTHPHIDHTGGTVKAVEYFSEASENGINQIIMSDYSTILVDSQWQENLEEYFIELFGLEEEYVAQYGQWEVEMEALTAEKQKLYIQQKTDQFLVENEVFIHPEVGDIMYLGDAKIEIIGPNSDTYSEANDYSIVMKVTYGEVDILLTGDAEKLTEREMLEAGYNLDAEVLKLGHHGSNTSTSKEFIEAVSPEYCIISCKKGHKDANPDPETVATLKEGSYIVRRTDENGDVVMVTDGENIYWNCEPGDYLSGVELEAKGK